MDVKRGKCVKVWVRVSLLALLAWTMGVTVLRAVRLPNDFAEAHWLIDYRFGFIKRGLVGSITGGLATVGVLPQTEFTVRILSFVAFGVFCLATLLVMWRTALRSHWDYAALLVLGVFATSPFLVMSAHLMGYFDHIFMPLALLSAWLVIRGRSWTAGIVAAIAVLSHETFVVVGLPIVLFAAYVRIFTTRERRWYRQLVPLFLLPGLAVLSLIANDILRPGQPHIALMLMFRLQNAGFIGANRANWVPEWLTTSFRAYYDSQSWHLAERLTSHSTWINIPTLVALFVFAAWGARKYAVPFARPIIFLLTLAPLAVHLIAWDTGRISTYCIFTAFACAWVYSETNPPLQNHFANDRLRYALLWLVTTPLFLFNVYTHEDLMDGQLERFTATTRLLLYAPWIVGTLILIVVLTRKPTRQPASWQVNA